MLISVKILIFLSVKMDFILVNVSLEKAILLFISVLHLTSGVIVKPTYLKVPTCFILSPLQRILHTGMSDCFEMTRPSVFFACPFDCVCCKDVLKFFFRVSD